MSATDNSPKNLIKCVWPMKLLILKLAGLGFLKKNKKIFVR